MIMVGACAPRDTDGAFGVCTTAPVACSLKAEGTCLEVVGSAASQSQCDGATSPDLCPTEGLTGCCVFDSGTRSETVQYFFEDAATAKAACGDGGGEYSTL